jgi:hypothetical protein
MDPFFVAAPDRYLRRFLACEAVQDILELRDSFI